jgi:hypothetical protein
MTRSYRFFLAVVWVTAGAVMLGAGLNEHSNFALAAREVTP